VKHLGGGKAGVGRRALERGKAVNGFALDTQYLPAGDQDMKLRQLGKSLSAKAAASEMRCSELS
jgi:hypothetical protein